MKLKNKANKGITLVALVITIIILLILAGVTILSISGENGLLNKSSQSKEEAIKAQYEEELNLTIASMRIDSIYQKEEFNMNYIIKKLPEYLESENKKDYEWNEEQNLEEPIGEYKEYKFYIDKEYVAHIEDKEKSLIPLEGLKNRWNLGIENSDFIIYKGKPEYKGKTEGVYLNNSILTTEEQISLKIPYTIVFENKNITTPPEKVGLLVGIGKGCEYVERNCIGVGLRNNQKFDAYTGPETQGTEYMPWGLTIEKNEEVYKSNMWHIFTIRNDGNEYSFFIDGELKSKHGGYTIVNSSKLYVGGFDSADTTFANVNWGYANGYYRNLAIYDVALTDEQIQNYSF